MSDEVESLAITVGGTIAATTTIDAIMTSLFPTRTSDLAGTPVYTWIGNGPPVLAASWPASTTPQGQCVQLLARFEVHSVLPAVAGP
jgi:hypothetical protein